MFGVRTIERYRIFLSKSFGENTQYSLIFIASISVRVQQVCCRYIE